MDHYRKDLDTFCRLLNQNDIRYMIVGGLAVNYHGFQRATGDIDLWYKSDASNYSKLLVAIRDFGYDTTEIESQKYYSVKGLIRLPLERYSIELLSIIDGKFSFDQAYDASERVKIIREDVPVMSYDYLIENKLMARRPKDLEDVRQLEMRRKAR